MKVLRQSTATTVMLGPFVDATDGVTAETALTPAVRVDINGGGFAARSSATAIAHDESGYYTVPLDTTDTGTLGRVTLAVTNAAHVPVFDQYTVVPATVFDALVSGTSTGIRADVQQLAANSITAGVVATGAIDADAVATDAVTEIQSGLATAAALATVDANVDAILLDTGTSGVVVAGTVSADVVSISGDSVAADNLEATFDGTGYADPNAPATQAQAGAIASTSTALVATVSDSNTDGTDPLNGVAFVGVLTSGASANLTVAGGTGLTLDDTANEIDAVFQIDVPPNAVPLSISFDGYLQSSNDTCPIQVYDHVGTTWETRATLNGTNGTNNTSLDIPLGESRFSSAAGAVFVRFHTSGGSNPTLFLDRVTSSYLNQTVGYSGGFIYINTNDGTAGTVPFVNGVADLPVDSIADAITIDGSVDLERFYILAGSSVTLPQNFTAYEFDGAGWVLNLGTRQLDSCVFRRATVVSSTGTVSSGAVPMVFQECLMGPDATVTISQSSLFDCGIVALTLGAAGNYSFINCQSAVPGTSAPVIDFGSLAVNVEFRRWSGGLTLSNVAAGAVISVDAVSGGNITINGTGGTVSVRGLVTVVDGSSGAVTIEQSRALNRTTIQALVLDDATPFSGADVAAILTDTAAIDTVTASTLDAAISTRASQASVDTVDSNVDAILVDTAAMQPTIAGNLDVALSDIAGATFDTATDSLEAIRNRGDAAWTTGAGGSGWSSTELEQIRYRLSIDGTQTNPTTSAGDFETVIITNLDVASSTLATAAALATVDTVVDRIEVDTTAIEADTQDIQGRLPAALVSGRIDASVGAMAADTLTASALAADAVAEIADGVLDESLLGHTTANSLGAALLILKAVNGKSNVRYDNFSYTTVVDSNGDDVPRLDSCRIRVFPTAADASAQTNVLHTVTVSLTPDGTITSVPSVILGTGA